VGGKETGKGKEEEGKGEGGWRGKAEEGVGGKERGRDGRKI